MSAPTCATCRWWEWREEDCGYCHRRAPICRVNTIGEWPMTSPTDWCGEHSPLPIETSAPPEVPK